jgi:hypothetical protein
MDDPIEKKESITTKDRIINVLILIAIIIFLIPILIYLLILEIIFRIIFRIRIIINGKRIIFVTSNSPIWHDYLKNKWVKRITKYAYILNWSERTQWNNSQWEVRMFHHWGGDRDMVPIIIVYINFFHIQKYRLYNPFIEYKNGKDKTLFTIESNIEKTFDSINNQ